MKLPSKRTRPLHPDPGPYRQLWRLVDGAVADAFKCHPDYLTAKGHILDNARRSVTKRVVGAVLGYAGQAARGSNIAPAMSAGADNLARGRSSSTQPLAAHTAPRDLQSS